MGIAGDSDDDVVVVQEEKGVNANVGDYDDYDFEDGSEDSEDDHEGNLDEDIPPLNEDVEVLMNNGNIVVSNGEVVYKKKNLAWNPPQVLALVTSVDAHYAYKCGGKKTIK